MTLRRALDTVDDKDFILTADQPFEIAYALNNRSNDFEVIHRWREGLDFTISSSSTGSANYAEIAEWDSEPIVMRSRAGDEKDKSIMIIVFVILGGLLLMAFVAIGIFYCKNRKSIDRSSSYL